jgi:glycosyltransferase involved in cell wall biosynthesis
MGNRSQVVLFVSGLDPRRVGGIEVHTHEVVRRLEERGWSAVLCFLSAPRPEVREYLSLPNVTWETLPDLAHTSLATVCGLTRILRRYRPSVLHLQFTPFLSLYGWLARLNGVQHIVLTVHGSRPEGYQAVKRPLWKRVAANFLNYPVSQVIGVSDYSCRAIVDLGYLPESRIQRIYNGVDLSRIDAASTAGERFRRQYGIPLDRILVTQVSWIIPEKGIPDTLAAARLALSTQPLLHFLMVGDGKYLTEYKAVAAAIGLDGHITWTGLVVDPIKDGVFAATDIYWQPSRWEEAFGLSIAEAMAAGKPVIATRVGGIPELVEDGITGILVARGDTASLANSVVVLARDRELRERLGRAAKCRTEVHFNVTQNVSILLDLYKLDETAYSPRINLVRSSQVSNSDVR